MKYFFLNIFICILLFIILLTDKITSVRVKTKKKEQQKYVDFTRDRYKISYYRINSETVLECNGYVFANEIYAINYYRYLWSNTTEDKSQYRPTGGSRRFNITHVRNKYLIKEYSAGMYFLKNPFSTKIHGYVWDGCEYNCYSQNNFMEFRKRVVKELNLYRQLHGAGKLIYSVKFSKIAQSMANERAQKGIHSHCDRNPVFGCLAGSLMRQNIGNIISSMYNDLLGNYDFAFMFLNRKKYYPLQLIWKSSKYFGVGIAEDSFYAYVVLTFSSILRNDKNYYKNVSPIQKKFIALYTRSLNRRE
ncbi:CAP domain-containing protein [Strongyloides ratti]|uniref:CAP domain-containing protein n=1 Tax=Strongyloides ratti TaxID=34506 RepID=A0A090L1I9_STRRB|nr:CAP domain-containing protein [Strongyloides ratti]CEF63561.1 CAP domain-containing protein [Strongyloides ratti]